MKNAPPQHTPPPPSNPQKPLRSLATASSSICIPVANKQEHFDHENRNQTTADDNADSDQLKTLVVTLNYLRKQTLWPNANPSF